MRMVPHDRQNLLEVNLVECLAFGFEVESSSGNPEASGQIRFRKMRKTVQGLTRE
jgi:hypothetical protein